MSERHDLLLALARADGQPWASIAEATEHTAEMMYGKQADAVEALYAERDVAERVREALDDPKNNWWHTGGTPCVPKEAVLEALGDPRPSWLALFGIAPNFTGGKDVGEYLDECRGDAQP